MTKHACRTSYRTTQDVQATIVEQDREVLELLRLRLPKWLQENLAQDA